MFVPELMFSVCVATTTV